MSTRPAVSPVGADCRERQAFACAVMRKKDERLVRQSIRRRGFPLRESAALSAAPQEGREKGWLDHFLWCLPRRDLVVEPRDLFREVAV